MSKYTKSIITDETDICFICRQRGVIHFHHIIYGSSNRDNSEKYGLKVPLCLSCHEGNNGVHHNDELDLSLKQEAQRAFEANVPQSAIDEYKLYSTKYDWKSEVDPREVFIYIFGQSFL